MASSNTICDVFISHAPKEAALALELADACRLDGLNAFTSRELLVVDKTGDAVRDALTESLAVVVVLSPAPLTPWMGIEIGAAQAWDKPLFVVLTDPSLTRLPVFLTRAGVYPPERIGDVVEAIKQSGPHFSEEDRSHLAHLVQRLGVSVDQLELDSLPLQKLVKEFNKRTHQEVSVEQLFTELLRLRKQGRLAGSRTTNPSRQRDRVV